MSKKKSSTIENRVYLFDSLSASLLAGGVGDLLASADDKERERALRALADAAFVSCVVADTAELDAATVRDRIASQSEPDTDD